MDNKDELILSDQPITLYEVLEVALEKRKVILHPTILNKMNETFLVLEKIVMSGQQIYGITTGFGSLSEIGVTPEESHLLQKKLILSHAQGLGEPLPEPVIRAMLLLRAHTLLNNYSGVRGELVRYLIEFLNNEVYPVVPRRGSVGASGDLIPLAHLAQPLVGEGEVQLKGQHMKGNEALDFLKLKPYPLKLKEGLALINGTQAMLSLLIYSYHLGKNLWKLFNLAASMTIEAMRSSTSFLEDEVFTLRPHKGFKETILSIRDNLRDSKLINPLPLHRVQEAYSIRCIPQVHGTVFLALSIIKDIIETEINSVTDNPLITSDGRVISQGNFHGAPLAWAADTLNLALSFLGSISERRVDKILSGTYEKSLHTYLAERPGVDNGLMLLQYQAASLVNYNKVLTHPASSDSIPTAQGQEDHVSMGMNAVLKLLDLINNLYSLVTIELYVSFEAVRRQGLELSGRGTRRFFDENSKFLTPFKEDRSLSRELEDFKRFLLKSSGVEGKI